MKPGDQPYFERVRRLRRRVLRRAQRLLRALGDRRRRADLDARRRVCRLGVLGTGTRAGPPAALAQIRVGEHGFAYLVDSTGTISTTRPATHRADARQHPAVAALLNGETGAQTMPFATAPPWWAMPYPLRERASSSSAMRRGLGPADLRAVDDIIEPVL